MALECLGRGDFWSAQGLLEQNARSGDYRTYNNLGYFYLENGRTRKNGKDVSGMDWGKKYLCKANKTRKTKMCLSNMAFYYAEFENNDKKAFQCYREAYESFSDSTAAYNMAVCLFKQKKYRDCVKILSDGDFRDTDVLLMKAFALLSYDREAFRTLVSQNDIRQLTLDEDVMLLLSYFQDPNMDLSSDVEKCLDAWSPNEDMWAILIDIWMTKKESKRSIVQWVEDGLNEYEPAYGKYEKKKKKIISMCIHSENKRKKYIASHLPYTPVYKHLGGYYGIEEPF